MKTVRIWILAGAIFLPGTLWALLARGSPPLIRPGWTGMERNSSAHAAAPNKTLCVNPPGSGGCYRSVNAAAAAAQPGDVIQVAAGVYTDTHISLPPNARLLGAGQDLTILDGQDEHGPQGVVVSAGPGSRVESLTIMGAGPGYYDAGIQSSTGQVTIRDVRLTGNAAGLWALCFDPATCGLQVTLEDSLVDKNKFTGVNSNETPRFILRGNTLAGNHGPAIVLNHPDSQAENNLVAFNEGDGLVNNAGASVRYNDVYGNARDYAGGGPGEGGFSADPLFRDPTNGDYRLQAASPAIGAGLPHGTDLGAEPFNPSGEPPEELSLRLASCNQWQVNVSTHGTPGHILLYTGPASRETTQVRELEPGAAAILENMSEAEGSYLAASQVDAQGRESAVLRYQGAVKPCPSPPVALQVGAFPGGEMRLAWHDASLVETAILVERASGSDPGTGYQVVETLPADTQVYTDTPPVMDATYWYRLRAVNASGSSIAGLPSYSAAFQSAPNPDERYLLVLANAARAAPQSFGYASQHAAPPLVYHPLLSYSARAHSQAIVNADFKFGQIDPLGRGPTERAQAVGFDAPVSEILLEGLDGAAWVKSTLETFLGSEPERSKLLCACNTLAGVGHTFVDPGNGYAAARGQYTVDLAGPAGVAIPRLPGGIVVPYRGGPASVYSFLVNYYHPDGQTPESAQVVIDGAAYGMQLAFGVASNGTYLLETTLTVGPHEYYFEFSEPGGRARLPETGSFSGPDVWGAYLPLLNAGR